MESLYDRSRRADVHASFARFPYLFGIQSALLGLLISFSSAANAQQDVTQPGDPIIASSANSPGSEGVANAIDGQRTKYLNFDSDADAAAGFKPSGFVVTPSVGVTRVTGLTLQSANDAPDRDPKVVTIEGSNDGEITAFDSGSWELITRLDDIPSWLSVFGDTDHRYQTQTFTFPNFKAYKHYRFTVVETQGPSTCCMQIAEVELLGNLLPGDVTQPGDSIVASSANSPGSEGVANAIDGQRTKYLNFDSDSDAAAGFKPSGFAVTPAIGRTVVTGMTLQSANDAPDRDPKAVRIEGSNDDEITAFDSGTWEVITTITDIPSWTSVFGDTDHRYQTQTFLFDNVRPYKHYRWTVTETQGPSTCCMQIAEVELLGTSAPKDITQPGDPIIASSANSPGSEGVANAIDGQRTKYLNFDSDADAAAGFKPSGFVVTPSIGATTITGMSLLSANDAPDRDPKAVRIEGSNDEEITSFDSGTWEVITNISDIPSWPSVFGDDDHRYKTQEFFFTNNKSYKHYRWTVVETQGPSTCCMQIAEVELLAVTQQADCTQAAFLTQPVNTPVLEGSSATFFTVVNGPWPLQWYQNGQPIPGATSASYTTPPVTTQTATNIYTVEIVGCEMSSPAMAQIFSPSPTKSIGISFVGSGANGAPTSMEANDIAGLHLQGFWNNATGGSGDLPGFDAEGNTIPLVDSDNAESTISFTWETSGTWGSGTGISSPTQRMLNGLVFANPGTTANLTFFNVPAGSHTVIAYIVNIPLQFQNVNIWATGENTQTNYIRAMNADEYNAAPGFFRGSSTDPNNRTVASYVRFDNVRPTGGAGGTITLSWDTLTTGFDRGAAVNAVQLILNSQAAGAPPVITAEPAPTVVAEGGTATVSVTATGSDLTYQWRKNGRNLPNGGKVSGANSSTLRISSFGPDDEGIYSVAIFNPGGSTISRNASVQISKFDISDALAGYWKFDETSGTIAANAAPGGKPGTVRGTASWGPGQIANALTFDGISTYVFVDSYTKASRAIAASAWVFVDPSAAASVTFIRNGEGNLRRGTDSNPAATGQFELGLVFDDVESTLRLSAAIQAGPNIPRATASTKFPVGSWQHVAFTADGAQVRLYHNGVEVASTDYLDRINAGDVPHLTMGAQLHNDPAVGQLDVDLTDPKFLPGRLDDVALWTRSLSEREVTAIFEAGNAKQPVTSVTITPPSGGDTEPTLTVSASGGNVTITWDQGTLQSAPSVTGPWTDVAGASPLTEAVSGTAKFYRAVAQ